MIRESQKKVAENVGDGIYREVTIKLNQHYHDNTKKLVKTEEISRTLGRLFRVAKPGEKVDTQLMCEKTFAVLSLVQIEDKTAEEEKASFKIKSESVSGTLDKALGPDRPSVKGSTEDVFTDSVTEKDDMRTRKTRAKTASAKKGAKANKTGAKEPKVKKSMSQAKKSVSSEDAKGNSTTGRYGMPIDLSKKRLNPKEIKVLSALNHGSSPRKISEIADIWKGIGAARANSWVRNSLRRLVRGGLVEQVDRGTYRLTAKGKKREASSS